MIHDLPAATPTVEQVAKAACKAHHDAANAIENDAQLNLDKATDLRRTAAAYADTLRTTGDHLLEQIANSVATTRAKALAIIDAGSPRSEPDPGTSADPPPATSQASLAGGEVPSFLRTGTDPF